MIHTMHFFTKLCTSMSILRSKVASLKVWMLTAGTQSRLQSPGSINPHCLDGLCHDELAIEDDTKDFEGDAFRASA